MIAIYVAELCVGVDSRGIYPTERREAIEAVGNLMLKNQKISSWKLLERAINDCFGYGFEKLHFSQSGSAKWECDKLYFSLSHTSGQVAVAVSDQPVGVDVESFQAFKKRCASSAVFRDSLAKKIVRQGESVSDDIGLLKLWTQKESVYKCGVVGAFAPDKLPTAERTVRTVEYGEYCLSVCGSLGIDLHFFKCEAEEGKGYLRGKEFFPL